MKYRVTNELSIPWWVKLFRFFRLKRKGVDFELNLNEYFNTFKIGDILYGGQGKIKILELL